MLNFHNLDFRLDKFHQLCLAITDNYTTITMDRYMTAGDKLSEHFVLMHHDVDRRPKKALKTTCIEEELGIQATDYFRTLNNVLIHKIIQKIEKIRHEVGYHHDVLRVVRK